MDTSNTESLLHTDRNGPTVQDFRQWGRLCVMFACALAIGYVIAHW